MSTPANEPVNPYASPPSAGGFTPPPVQPGCDGLWRHRNVLVMLRKSPLPPICLKSGQPASLWLRRDLQWHEPWIFATILAGVFWYFILAGNMTKRASLMIGLSDEWAARRRTRMMIATAIALAGIAVGVAGCILNGEHNQEGWLLLLPVAILILIGAAIYGKYACRLVWPQRITDQYIFLKGVHPSVLAQLPEWLD